MPGRKIRHSLNVRRLVFSFSRPELLACGLGATGGAGKMTLMVWARKPGGGALMTASKRRHLDCPAGYCLNPPAKPWKCVNRLRSYDFADDRRKTMVYLVALFIRKKTMQPRFEERDHHVDQSRPAHLGFRDVGFSAGTSGR
jgi:hypothetical protein